VLSCLQPSSDHDCPCVTVVGRSLSHADRTPCLRVPCGPGPLPLPPIGLTAADPFAGGEVSRVASRVRSPGSFPVVVGLRSQPPLTPYRRRITIRRQSGGGPLHLPRSCRRGPRSGQGLLIRRSMPCVRPVRQSPQPQVRVHRISIPVRLSPALSFRSVRWL